MIKSGEELILKRLTQDMKSILFVHRIYDSPVYFINNKYDIWGCLNSMAVYDYVVNGLKFKDHARQLSKCENVFK